MAAGCRAEASSAPTTNGRKQGSALLPQLPRFFQETLLPLLEDLEEKWSSLLQRRDAAGWTGSLETVLQNAVSSLSGQLLSWLGGFVAALPSILFTCVFTVLSTVFFLPDYAHTTGLIVRSLP